MIAKLSSHRNPLSAKNHPKNHFEFRTVLSSRHRCKAKPPKMSICRQHIQKSRFKLGLTKPESKKNRILSLPLTRPVQVACDIHV